MVDEIIGAVLQVVGFSLIPFVVYFIRKRSVKGFLGFIGFKKSTGQANLLAFGVMLLFAAPTIIFGAAIPEMREVLLDPKSITGRFAQMGVSLEAIVMILVVAGIKTSLSEEILFRGFIAKRLIAITNYRTGNILQAVIFALIHVVLFAMISSNLLFLVVIFVIPLLGSYATVYLNEKLAGGSIIPGWIAHGLANVTAYSTFMIVGS